MKMLNLILSILINNGFIVFPIILAVIFSYFSITELYNTINSYNFINCAQNIHNYMYLIMVYLVCLLFMIHSIIEEFNCNHNK